MVLNHTAFQDATNGREKTTDGLWTHRGTLSIRDATSPSGLLSIGGGQGYTQLNQSLFINRNPPSLDWTSAELRLDTEAGSAPRIGFHESGVQAMSLYKKPGTQELWVGDVAAPYRLAGAPGSAAKYIGAYHSTSSFKLTQTGVWTETDVQFTGTFTGAPLTRFDFMTSVEGSGGGGFYLGIGIDGALTWPSLQVTVIQTGITVPMGGTISHLGMPAGTHRVALWLYGAAGNGFTAGGYSDLTGIEHRI